MAVAVAVGLAGFCHGHGHYGHYGHYGHHGHHGPSRSGHGPHSVCLMTTMTMAVVQWCSTPVNSSIDIASDESDIANFLLTRTLFNFQFHFQFHVSFHATLDTINNNVTQLPDNGFRFSTHWPWPWPSDSPWPSCFNGGLAVGLAVDDFQRRPPALVFPRFPN
jgi:hypothetical protein